jgi:hypothetical protein
MQQISSQYAKRATEENIIKTAQESPRGFLLPCFRSTRSNGVPKESIVKTKFVLEINRTAKIVCPCAIRELYELIA